MAGSHLSDQPVLHSSGFLPRRDDGLGVSMSAKPGCCACASGTICSSCSPRENPARYRVLVSLPDQPLTQLVGLPAIPQVPPLLRHAGLPVIRERRVLSEGRPTGNVSPLRAPADAYRTLNEPSANTVVDVGAYHRLQAFLCWVIREICAPELAQSLFAAQVSLVNRGKAQALTWLRRITVNNQAAERQD